MTINQINEDVRILCKRKAELEAAKEALVDALVKLEGTPDCSMCDELRDLTMSTPKYKRLKELYDYDKEIFENNLRKGGVSSTVKELLLEAIDTYYYLAEGD